MTLSKLTQAFGVSGYEKEIREIIKEMVKGYGDEVTVDALGNLIVFKKGNGENKKKIMASAHMDEIGFQVVKIDDKGLIKVRGLGGIPVTATIMNRIMFRNGTVGIVSNSAKIEDVKNDIKKLYVDIGAKSKEEALKFVKVGDVASYVGEYLELKDNNVTGKAIDDRIGCYIMIEALKKIENPYNDLYFVFSVQEEVGLRGATVAAERINPDLGIAIDVTVANDFPEAPMVSSALGEGTAIKVSDGSVICNEYLVEEMVKCCEENTIKYQLDVIDGGGTDAGAINRSNFGVRAAGISVATRYVHGPNCFVNMKDTQASIDLLSKYVNRVFDFE
ncbi:M20/M25/M40 family metallo-hydrolase [Clostridium sp. CS001]|uniref:M42 family metallopeptidase n=1 Tax=Clostridium sp. CS001 TaxID=2880648 RepID=UPI001CF2A94F|nr:M20/M25/M40 family metallo-hydrolase [Clostridium sp. CS001]MCB2289005.1 M20/M25/M40 family metallo-hydrolase [Clostridium sp. CS001]